MRNMLVGRRFQPIEKRCCNILGRLQKKEDEYLHLVSHDTMISRVQMSGLGLAAFFFLDNAALVVTTVAVMKLC